MAPAFRASPTRKYATTTQIQALPVDPLEAVAVGAAFSAAVALLDLKGLPNLTCWLAGSL